MWCQVGKKKANKIEPNGSITVHKVSSGKFKYLRLCFPKTLARGVKAVQFAFTNGGLAVMRSNKDDDSYHLSLDGRVGKNYVTFPRGELPIRRGRYFASVPANKKEGLGNVLFFLHPAKVVSR